jgi:hypothetical protein
MSDDLYAELRSWQTAIGAILGFLALMSGALWNFYLNRRRDARLRRGEAIAVAVALYGEIVLLRREVAKIGNAVADRYMYFAARKGEIFDKHFVEAHEIPNGFIYENLADKLGFLNPDLIIEIAEFYQNLQEVRSWLPRLVDDETRKYHYSVLYVLHPARDAVTKINPALKKIEKMAQLKDFSSNIDIGKIEQVIDFEESSH